MIFYASGTNHPGEIRGLAKCLHSNVGTCVQHISGPAEGKREAFRQLVRFPRQVFVDSGAFSEVNKELRVVRPLAREYWENVFAVYDRLAMALGPRLSIVAPDRIACEHTSLDRLAQWAHRIGPLQEKGVRVLVPLQGEPVTFFDKAKATLGPAIVPAFPMKKNATEPTTVAKFLSTVHPSQVHFLGMGPDSTVAKKVLPLVPASVGVSADSCLFKRYVGRKRSLGPLTAAHDFFDALLVNCGVDNRTKISIKKNLGLQAVLWDFWESRALRPSPRPKPPTQLELGL